MPVPGNGEQRWLIFHPYILARHMPLKAPKYFHHICFEKYSGRNNLLCF